MVAPQPGFTQIEKNVLWVITMLVKEGKRLKAFPDLGPYTHICKEMAPLMEEIPDREDREEVLAELCIPPNMKAFEALLIRGYGLDPILGQTMDPPPPPPDSALIERNVCWVIKMVVAEGKQLHEFPELGSYTFMCQEIARMMQAILDYGDREDLLARIRAHPKVKDLDMLLKRHYNRYDPHGYMETPLRFQSLQDFQPPQHPQPAPAQHPQHPQHPQPAPAQPSQPVVTITNREVELPPLKYSILDPALAQGACPWLDDAYVPFSRKWSPRAPDIHHIGCGLWVLSTIAMRRVAARDGRKLQHTPLYVQLVAPSSVWGKTTTATIAVNLVEQLGLGWTLSPSMITPEKFLKNLSGGRVPDNYDTLDERQKELVRVQLAHSGQRGWYYSEFGQMLREMSDNRGRNALFKPILLRMDDCELTSRYDTIGRDLEEIQLPYLSLLGTMTPECMRPYSGSDSSSWGDGFYARFALCCVPLNLRKTQQDLEREQFPTEEGHFPATILQPVLDWHIQMKLSSCQIVPIYDVKGDFAKYTFMREPLEAYPITVLELHPDARIALNDYNNALALHIQDNDLVQFSSYYSRLRDKTLRIATLFAALQGSPTIELRHIARAQQIAEQFRLSIHQLGAHLKRGYASSRNTDHKILKVLADKNVPLSAREICQYIGGLEANEARERLAVLELDGMVKKREDGRTSRYAIENKM